MRRALLVAVLVTTFAVGTVAVAARPIKPSLNVFSLQPFGVHGQGFRPLEHVRVALVVSSSHIRHAMADKRGAFVASFTGVVVGRCDPFAVVARGVRGSKAVVRRREVPADCPGPSPAPVGPKYSARAKSTVW